MGSSAEEDVFEALEVADTCSPEVISCANLLDVDELDRNKKKKNRSGRSFVIYSLGSD